MSSLSNQNSNIKSPIDILKQISSSQSTGNLYIYQEEITYSIYFYQGKIFYASHSIDPLERVERYFRRLSNENSNLTSDIRTKARLNSEANLNDSETKNLEYQAICWLLENKYINDSQLKSSIEYISQEVFESLLLIPQVDYNFDENLELSPILCKIELENLLEKTQKSLEEWRKLSPKISSPYQRVYYSSKIKKKTPSQEKLSRLLVGFSFRQLGALLNQNELKLAQSLYPLILKGVVSLKDPQNPFDKLPKIAPLPSNDELELEKIKELPEVPQKELEKAEETKELEETEETEETEELEEAEFSSSVPGEILNQQKSKIACIDDSQAILNSIDQFLSGHYLEVFTINNPVKALMEIIRIKPNLILLDVGMPQLDGYQLCRMIRKNSLFKNTPIVMVTGNTGLIDRAKARVSGATDYMTKPFTQSELIKMVFRYLT